MSAHGRYPVPAEPVEVEETIRRSRFVTRLGGAATVDEAKGFVDAMRRDHPGATHCCWAYLVGPPGSTALVGMSDDGEPHNTAGRPMLTVLQHCGAGDVVAAVARYFGGVKLGTGGLARAYSGGVKEALARGRLVDKVAWRACRLVFEYSLLEPIRRALDGAGATIDGERFGEAVTLDARVPDDRAEELLKLLSDRWGGRVELTLA